MRLWNPGTNRVCTSRDVIWMKQMYYKKTSSANSELEYLDKEEDDAAEESMNDSDSNSGSSVESKAGETVSDTLVTTTRSGRTIVPPDRLIETMTPFADADLSGTAAELHYFGALAELDNEKIAAFKLILVGAGLGGGFEITTELKVMKFKETMKGNNKKYWIKEVATEKSWFDRFNALTAVKKKDLPKGPKVMTSTWAMKQKANGTDNCHDLGSLQ